MCRNAYTVWMHVSRFRRLLQRIMRRRSGQTVTEVSPRRSSMGVLKCECGPVGSSRLWYGERDGRWRMNERGVWLSGQQSNVVEGVLLDLQTSVGKRKPAQCGVRSAWYIIGYGGSCSSDPGIAPCCVTQSNCYCSGMVGYQYRGILCGDRDTCSSRFG